MSITFVKDIKIPLERVGVLVGKAGEVKAQIEEHCGVVLKVDGETGDVRVEARGDITGGTPFKAVEVVAAIARGFSPQRAFRLFEEGVELRILDLHAYAGKSQHDLVRIKGRVIGAGGRARRTIEELTNTYLSVYGDTIGIIGEGEWAHLAEEALRRLASGSPHQPVYTMLQRARGRAKWEKVKLWEEGPHV